MPKLKEANETETEQQTKKPETSSVQKATGAESSADSASTSSPTTTQSTEPTIKETNVKKSHSSPGAILWNYPESLVELPLSTENRDIVKSARKNSQKLLFTGEPKNIMTYACEWLCKADYGVDWDLFGRTFTADELNKNYRNGLKFTPRERLMAVLNPDFYKPNPLPFKTAIIEDADKLNESVLDMLIPNLKKLCRVIFIATNFEKVDKCIKKCTKRVHFAKLETNQIFQVLKAQAQKAEFEISDDDLNEMAEDSNGSLKAAIHDLRVRYMIAYQALHPPRE